MRYRIILAICLLQIATFGPLPLTLSQARPIPVILISIDGLKPDYVIEADKHRLNIPNLRKFVSDGTYATGVIGVLPTVTYPSHTTLVTGVAPARHGIIANTPFDPFGKNLGGWYWYTEDLKVQTLWDAAHDAGMVTASVDWPATVGANITHRIVQYWRTGTPDDRKLVRALSTPGLLTEVERAIGPYPEGKDYSVSADEVRAKFNIYLLENKRPRFQTVYFAGLDHDQHDYGPYSLEAFAALERIDALVGQVRAAAERLGGGQAVVCVVSDHGFSRAVKELRLNVALRNAGLIEVDGAGALKSWRAISWSSSGSAAVMLKDPADEEARRKVRATLAGLQSNTENGILKVYEGDALRALSGFPSAAFVVGVSGEYSVGGGYDGALVVATRPRGTHGYLPELPEMNSSFFIGGANVPRGRNLGTIDMRDVAPTLAKLLGVKLPAAEGRDVLSKK